MSDSPDTIAKKNQLLAEIENFANSDLMPMDQPMPRAMTSTGFPALDGREPAPRETPSGPAKAVAAAAPAPSKSPGGLLERLKQQAELKQNSESRQEGLQEQQKRLISAALGDAYGYLRDLVEQVNVLKPPSPSYFLGEQLTFDDLYWKEGRADLRKLESATDERVIKTVSLRYVLAGSAPILIEKEPPSLDLLKQTLNDYGLSFEVQEIKNDRSRTERGCFTIKREIRAGLLFSADYDAGDIHLRTLNVQRLGSAEYRIPAETLTHEVVEEIALLVLGESNQFVRRFKRIF